MRTCSIDKPGKGYRVHTRVILQYLVPEYVLLRSTPGRALLVASPRSSISRDKKQDVLGKQRMGSYHPEGGPYYTILQPERPLDRPTRRSTGQGTSILCSNTSLYYTHSIRGEKNEKMVLRYEYWYNNWYFQASRGDGVCFGETFSSKRNIVL